MGTGCHLVWYHRIAWFVEALTRATTTRLKLSNDRALEWGKRARLSPHPGRDNKLFQNNLTSPFMLLPS